MKAAIDEYIVQLFGLLHHKMLILRLIVYWVNLDIISRFLLCIYWKSGSFRPV